MELFRLLGKIAIENSEANSAIDETKEKSKSFGESLKDGIQTVGKWGAAIGAAAVAAGAAVVAFASKASAAGDKIDKMSQKIGISREAYQELDFICSQSGTSVDTLQMGIKTLTNQMQSAATGTKSAVSMFDQLGVSIYDANGQLKDQETMMWEAMSALQAMENQTEKAALATDLFGRSGSELMPLLNGAEGSIESMKETAHELGLVMSDEFVDDSVAFTDTMDQFKRSLSSAGMKIASAFLPHIQKFVDKLVQHMPKIQKFASIISDGIGTAVEFVSGKFGYFKEKLGEIDFSGIFENLSAFWEANGKPVFDAISSIFSQMDEGTVFENLQTGFQTLWDAIGEIWNSVGQPIWDAVMSAIQYVADNWQPISEKISTLFQTAWDLCNTAWTSIGQPIWDLISSAVSKASEMFSENMPKIMEFFEDAIDGIEDTWENHLKPVFEAIEKILKEVVQPAFEFVWETIIEPLIENTFGFIKDLWNDTLKPVFDGMCDFLTGVFTSDWETAMNGIGEIVDGVFSAIETTVESVIGFFSDAIGKIKEFLGVADEANGVEVNTTTTTTTTGGVEKYASGAVLTRATAFGYNPYTGKTMIGGEAGAEAIAPIDVLQGYVRQAVAEQNQGMYMAFNRMVELLENYMPEIAANSHKQIVMNNGALVGELAPGIDRELGGIASWKGRGNR